MMAKILFEIDDYVCVKSTPASEYGENIYKQEVVISKEAFIECYNKWIKGEAEREK